MEKRINIAKIARQHGISPETIYYRMKKGLTLDQALAMGRARESYIHRYPDLKVAKYPRLAEYMLANRLTFRDFAEEVGLSYNTVQMMIYGDSEPLLSTIRKVCEATCMTFEEAFSEVQ